jgi:Heterokaryon incompatibility protein (HET)
VSFASPPPYKALSYTWGNPKGPKNHIPVKGNPEEIFQIQLEDKQKCITYNLKETLDQLRDETTLIRIWVDALCMDQKNMTEQSEQVKSMAKLYGQASRVIVWLGEMDLYVDTAFGTLEELCWATKFPILHCCAEKLKVP